MIQINLLRISSDSKYIEFSVECPENYRFNTLYIKKYDWQYTPNYPNNSLGWIDASSVYKKTSTKEVIRISTAIFGGSSMFYLEFGVKWIGTEEEPTPCNGIKLSDNTTIGVCSDINNVYTYLFQGILSVENKCSGLSDDLKKAYVILNGHIGAMKLERFDEAEHFYDVLKNNFSNCLNPNRVSGNCGCQNG